MGSFPRNRGKDFWRSCEQWLRHFAVIKLQKPAERAVAENRFGKAHRRRPVARSRVGFVPWEQKPVVFTLMGSFMVVMGDIFRDGMSEGGFAEEDHAVEAFGLGGWHESFVRHNPLDRRMIEAVSDTGVWDCTYHYYLDGQRVVKERNGSLQNIKEFVWGIQYVDDLIMIARNSDPIGQVYCDSRNWACQDANWRQSRDSHLFLFNIIGDCPVLPGCPELPRVASIVTSCLLR